MKPTQEKPEQNSAAQNYISWAGCAVRGVAWTYAALLGSRIVAFVSMIVLARILMPSAFGQLGFALLVITYLDALGDLGAGSALIFHQKRSKEAAQVAFRINLLTGALWWGVATMLAPLVADFFRDQTVEPLLRSLAWIFPITALGNTHDAILRRNLSFGRRLVPDYARSLLKALCAVVLAWQGWGVWSLVWGQLIGVAASTLALWTLIRWRPVFRVSMILVRPMLRYGSHIVLINILSTLVHHVDLLVVGRILGSAALGFYTLASRIPEVCITMIIWAVNRVAFPTYAKLQDNPATLRQAFRYTLRYISIVTLPIGLGLAFTAGMIIPLLYGNRWLPAVPALVGLAIATVLRSLGSLPGDIFKAIGRPDILTKLGIVRAVVLVPVLIWSAKWGIAGVAGAQAIVTAASTLAMLLIAGRILSIPFSAWCSDLRPAAIGTAGMVLVLLTIRPLAVDWPLSASLFSYVIAGAASYAAGLLLCNPYAVQRIGTRIASALGRSE